jgi:hypothetical protein
MSEKSVITLEQLKQYLNDFPGELTDAQRRKVAKQLGHELPEAPPPELSVQLQEVKVVRDYVGKKTKRNPNPQPKDYIAIPSLKMVGDGAKGFWVRTSVARAVAERILAVCDAEGIE